MVVCKRRTRWISIRLWSDLFLATTLCSSTIPGVKVFDPGGLSQKWNNHVCVTRVPEYYLFSIMHAKDNEMLF